MGDWATTIDYEDNAKQISRIYINDGERLVGQLYVHVNRTDIFKTLKCPLPEMEKGMLVALITRLWVHKDYWQTDVADTLLGAVDDWYASKKEERVLLLCERAETGEPPEIPPFLENFNFDEMAKTRQSVELRDAARGFTMFRAYRLYGKVAGYADYFQVKSDGVDEPDETPG